MTLSRCPAQPADYQADYARSGRSCKGKIARETCAGSRRLPTRRRVVRRVQTYMTHDRRQAAGNVRLQGSVLRGQVNRAHLLLDAIESPSKQQPPTNATSAFLLLSWLQGMSDHG